MKIAYIAGPYTSKSPHKVDHNILNARQVAIQLANHGVMYFCPHLNSAQFERLCPKVPARFFHKGTLEMLKRCDFVICVPGWDCSTGAVNEVNYAQKNGMRVFRSIHEFLASKFFKIGIMNDNGM